MPVSITRTPYKHTPAENPVIFTVSGLTETGDQGNKIYVLQNTGATIGNYSGITNTNVVSSGTLTAGQSATTSCYQVSTFFKTSNIIIVSQTQCGTPPAVSSLLYYKVELYEANSDTLVYTGNLYPTPINPTFASINLSQQLQALVRSDIDNSDDFLLGKPRNSIAYKVRFIDYGFSSTTSTQLQALSTGITSSTFYAWESKLDVLNYTNDLNEDKYVVQSGQTANFLTYQPNDKCVNEYSTEQLYFLQDLGQTISQFKIITSQVASSSAYTTILEFTGDCPRYKDSIVVQFLGSTVANYVVEGGGVDLNYLAACLEEQLRTNSTMLPYFSAPSNLTITRTGSLLKFEWPSATNTQAPPISVSRIAWTGIIPQNVGAVACFYDYPLPPVLPSPFNYNIRPALGPGHPNGDGADAPYSLWTNIFNNNSEAYTTANSTNVNLSSYNNWTTRLAQAFSDGVNSLQAPSTLQNWGTNVKARRTSNKTFEVIAPLGTGAEWNGLTCHYTLVPDNAGDEPIFETTTFQCGFTPSGTTNANVLFRPTINPYDNYDEGSRIRFGYYYYPYDSGRLFEWDLARNDFDAIASSFGCPVASAFNLAGYVQRLACFINNYGDGLTQGVRYSATSEEIGGQWFVRITAPSGGGFSSNGVYPSNADWIKYEFVDSDFFPTITQGIYSGLTGGSNSSITYTGRTIPNNLLKLQPGQAFSSTTLTSTTTNSGFIVTFEQPEVRAQATITITGTSAYWDNVCFSAITTASTATLFCYQNSNSANTESMIAEEIAAIFNIIGVFDGYTGFWNGDNTITVLAPVGLGAAGNNIILSGSPEFTTLPDTLPANPPTAQFTVAGFPTNSGQTSWIETLDYQLGNLVLANYTSVLADTTGISTYVSNLVANFNTNPYGYTASQIGADTISFTGRSGIGSYMNGNAFIGLSDITGFVGGAWENGTNSGFTNYDEIKYSITQFAGGVDYNPSVTGFSTDKVIRINASPRKVAEFGISGLTDGEEYQILLTDFNDNPISEIRRYKWCSAKCNVNYVNILWTNSLGGVDSYQFLEPLENVNSEKLSIVKNNINLDSQTPYITNGVFNKAEDVYLNKVKTSFVVFTQPLSDSESDWLSDMMASKSIYVELSNNQLVPIKLITTDYSVNKRRRIGNTLNQFSFQFQFDENYISPLSVNGDIIINN